MNKECANIFLSLNSSMVENNIYYVNNIKFQETLGELYFKYKRFKLIINAFCDGFTGGYNLRQIEIGGLPWENLPYKTQTNPRVLISGNGGVSIYPANSGFIFYRPASISSMTFRFLSILNVSSNIGTAVFLLSIYGIEDKIVPSIVNKNVSNFYLHSSNFATKAGGEYYFKNVKTRDILTNIYDKYETFKIVLTAFYNYNYLTISDSEKVVAIKMRGLSWLNNYDYPSYDGESPTLGIVMRASNSSLIQQTQGNWGCMFSKPQSSFVDLYINFYSINNAAVHPSAEYGTFCCMFSIYGIN